MEYSKEMLLDMNIIQNLKELGGDDDFFKEILDLYCAQYPELYKNIQESYLIKNYDSLSKYAHALKGASLNIGAKELAEICKSVEINSKNGLYDGLENLIRNIDFVKKITLEEMHSLL
jgi:HPt (histidine-containing phosphotransfer) domain-containing protein